MNKYMQWQ